MCSHCGGSNVFFDATAMWSIEKQDYIMTTTHDNTDCDDCGSECSVNWVPVEEPAQPEVVKYDLARIADELDWTAQGLAYSGNALRVAKDIPGVTDVQRSLLDRYATGAQKDTDHIALQDLAISIRLQGAKA